MTNAVVTISAIDRTKQVIDRFQGRMNRASSAITGTYGKLALLAGGTGLGLLIKRAGEAADNIGKMSDRLDISTESFAALHHQAKLTGTSAETVNSSLERMVKRLGEAADGQGAAAKMLDKLNLSATELIHLSADEQYRRIAEAIAGLNTHAEKGAAVAAIFGREGIKMVNMISQGEAGFNAATQAVREYGTALSRTEIKSIEDQNDAVERASEAWHGLVMRLTKNAAPVIERIARGAERVAIWLGKSVDQTSEEKANALFKERGELLEKIRLNLERTGGAVSGNVIIYRKQLAEITAELNRQVELNKNKALQEKKAAEAARVAREQEFEAARKMSELKAAEEEREDLQGDLEKTLVTLRSEEDAIRESFLERGLIIEEAYEAGLLKEKEYLDARLALNNDQETRLTELNAKHIDERVEQEKKASDLISDMRGNVVRNSINFLRALAGDSKKMAKAIFIIEKSLAIAQSIVNTQVAVTKALAIDPTGSLASRVQALGNISTGLIAATALVEGSGGSAGTSVGSSAGSVSSADAIDSSFTSENTSSDTRGSVNIYVNGVVTDEIVHELIVPALQDAVQNRDVVLINKDSRNGQELDSNGRN